MTLDQAVALSLLDKLPRVGLTARLLESDPELVELAGPLLERAHEERVRAAEAGIHVLTWNDPRMPAQLVAITDIPPVLWYRGSLECLNQPAVVWVFDGRELGSNLKGSSRSPAEIDPRNALLGAYAALPSFNYLGVSRRRGGRCWVFAKQEKAVESRFEIDVANNLPRRIVLRYANGREDEQTFSVLPEHRLRQPGLFDRDRLDAILIGGAEAMF